MKLLIISLLPFMVFGMEQVIPVTPERQIIRSTTSVSPSSLPDNAAGKYFHSIAALGKLGSDYNNGCFTENTTAINNIVETISRFQRFIDHYKATLPHDLTMINQLEEKIRAFHGYLLCTISDSIISFYSRMQEEIDTICNELDHYTDMERHVLEPMLRQDDLNDYHHPIDDTEDTRLYNDLVNLMSAQGQLFDPTTAHLLDIALKSIRNYLIIINEDNRLYNNT